MLNEQDPFKLFDLGNLYPEEVNVVLCADRSSQ